jgi:hypothetical protein
MCSVCSRIVEISKDILLFEEFISIKNDEIVIETSFRLMILLTQIIR